ncbi:MAG: C69 family dipeptidase [Bacteroidetes bacterium]|nr:C69 family dipeptidase [Bacteroidota bacterium]
MKRISTLITLILFLSPAAVFACTNFIVTKGASVDGSTMITYTADSYMMYGELYHFPAAKYPEGAMLEVFEWDTGKLLGKIKQVRETYNVTGNMNEHQLAIGETTFGGRGELTNPKGIIDYGSLIYITLQRAKTAREAIRIMAQLVEEYGYYSSGESFSIADPNEAWILEMIGKGPGVKGANWVAVRIPDGYVSGHANQARITKFPLNDPDNCLYSKDVISFAREKGYFSGKDADFDFAAAYSPLDFGAIRFCDGRVWSLFRRCNSTMVKYLSYIKGENLERMPLYVKPDKKLSVQDVMGLMRDHYNGTELDMTTGVGAGPYGNPMRARPLTWKYNGEEYFNERPISTPQTGWSFISQSRSHLPNEVGGLLWFGMDDTYTTVWFPVYAAVTDVPENYRKGLGSLSHFTWESAFWVFNAVANFAYPRYNFVIDDIRTVQNQLEGQFLLRQKEVEEKAAKLLSSSRAECLMFLTNYTKESGKTVYNTWKKLSEDLLLRYVDGVKKNEYFKTVNIGYPDDFKKQIVSESGDKLKVKKLPGEKEAAIGDHINNAKELIKKKDYVSAKSELESLLKLDPGNSWASAELKKVNDLLRAIEDLHNKNFGMQ